MIAHVERHVHVAQARTVEELHATRRLLQDQAAAPANGSSKQALLHTVENAYDLRFVACATDPAKARQNLLPDPRGTAAALVRENSDGWRGAVDFQCGNGKQGAVAVDTADDQDGDFGKLVRAGELAPSLTGNGAAVGKVTQPAPQRRT